MTPFADHTGLAVPLVRANVDTDVIIRMNRCASEPRDRLGLWAFESLRMTAEGVADPGCVFNQAAFRDASILVAGPNFGCGSSREMAVWALQGMGLRCVVAPGFGDIFFANCFQNGLLPVQLPEATVEALQAQAAGGQLVLDVDLSAQTISGASDGPISFDIEPLRKSMLMSGLDEISMSLQHERSITKWQQHDRAARPWIYSRLRT
ncbi:MAG: 3-isopropylmalate dehydratase small subunit [Rhodoferax sp.]|nr:3-isopropylmalate dehydratase small subunit [Rhodoferax sp.]